MSISGQLKFNADGLIPVVVQDYRKKDVLMVAYMNRQALGITLKTRKACYWSRSRKKLWRKGEESGNVQVVKRVWADCDADVLLLEVHQKGGAACHMGFRSCFFRRISNGRIRTVGRPVFDPTTVYAVRKRS